MATIDDLQFVHNPEDGTGRNFWCVETPNDMVHGACLGRLYAINYFEFEAENDGPKILCSILKDMATSGPLGSIEKNFIFTVSEALEVALQNPWFVDAIKMRQLC